MGATAKSGREVYSSPHWKEYTSFGADIDITADAPNAANGKVAASRRIRIGAGGGNIVLKTMDGTSRITTGCLAGEILDVQATTIVSALTTVTNVTVYW